VSGGHVSKASTAAFHAAAQSYQGLVFFPARPGQSLDMELFLKLRQKVKRLATEETGIVGVRDDAIALLACALEQHVKNVIESSFSHTRRRQHSSLNRMVEPVDMFGAVRRNPAVFGDEFLVDAERLALLI